ncbi:hypothetical protein OU798_05390 [Prolixibacteraceae bacterium Z1-6]|uniref:Uncharacterized protein n=1 Tax=Draconibacterium aestuarii TaxID=2998507 RepID=A0A9X3FBB3_9BACT|nr:hypothetical protein [Prolixibacteraceae bacterium Z1-6]
MLDDLNRLKKQHEENKAHNNALFERFTQKLSPALNEVVFQHLAKNRNTYENELLKLGNKYARLIFENFSNAHWLNNNVGPMADLNAVPVPGSDRAEAEFYCQKLKEEVAEEFRAEVEKLYWEEYTKNQESEAFKYAVYQKMKAVFTEFYIDDIMVFESHILRYFDRSLYLMCTLAYVDEVYSLD